MSHALGVTVRTDFDVTVLCFVILYPNFPHFVTDPAKSLNFAKAQLYLTSCIGAWYQIMLNSSLSSCFWLERRGTMRSGYWLNRQPTTSTALFLSISTLKMKLDLCFYIWWLWHSIFTLFTSWQLWRWTPHWGKNVLTKCEHSESEEKLTEPWPEDRVWPRFRVTVGGYLQSSIKYSKCWL